MAKNLSRRNVLRGALAASGGIWGLRLVAWRASLAGAANAAGVPSLKPRGVVAQLAADGAPATSVNSGVAFYAAINPLTKKPFPNPNVPFPTFEYAHVVQTMTDGRILALDASGNAVGRARWFPQRGAWAWVTDSESVTDYTIREYADALGMTFGSVGNAGIESWPQTKLKSEEFRNIVEKTSNIFDVSFALQQLAVFWYFDANDWRRVLANWSSVSGDLAKGKIPEGFNYSWNLADGAVSYFESLGMPIRGAGLLWGAMVPDSLRNGNFTSEELTKILEFMVKSRVLKYKGRIRYWAVAEEFSAHILTTPDNATLPEYGKNHFWYGMLGQYVNDSVANWTHQADPSARLIALDDNIFTTDWEWFKPDQDKFWELLTHWKETNVPIDIIGVENNVWIYAPPSKNQLLQGIRRIQSLGYEFMSSEVTVSVGQTDLWGPGRPKRQNPPDALATQAKVYRDLLEACIETGSTFWLGSEADTSDYSWFESTGRIDSKVALFDGNLKPKAAYFELLDVMKRKHAEYLSG